MSIVLIDSYSESNYSGWDRLNDDNGNIWGQSFTNTNSVTLDSVKFYLSNNDTGGYTHSGSAVAKLYLMAGTWGSTGVPTGSVLATSDTYDTSSLGSSFGLVTFSFSGANRIVLSATTYYVIVLNFSPSTGGDAILFGYDNTSPTFVGNACDYLGAWYYNLSERFIFYVYGDTGAGRGSATNRGTASNRQSASNRSNSTNRTSV